MTAGTQAVVLQAAPGAEHCLDRGQGCNWVPGQNGTPVGDSGQGMVGPRKRAALIDRRGGTQRDKAQRGDPCPPWASHQLTPARGWQASPPQQLSHWLSRLRNGASGWRRPCQRSETSDQWACPFAPPGRRSFPCCPAHVQGTSAWRTLGMMFTTLQQRWDTSQTPQGAGAHPAAAHAEG